MQTVVHVTHEAIHKIGGIGAVLHGLLTSRDYLDQAQRNILVGPFWPTDASGESRLGSDGEVLYSSLDSLFRSPLAVQLALQAPFRTCIGGEFFTERQQPCFTLTWHNGDGRGTQIKPDHVRSDSVFGFVMRDTFQDELHVVTIALDVCPLRVRTGCLAPDEPHILDRVRESMMHDRIMPVDQRRETIFAPKQPSVIALFWRLEEKP